MDPDSKNQARSLLLPPPRSLPSFFFPLPPFVPPLFLLLSPFSSLSLSSLLGLVHEQSLYSPAQSFHVKV